MESVPHVAPEHPLPDKLQVTPLPDVSLITVAVMLTDLPWSTVCAAEAMLTEIGRDGLPPPQPKSVTARTRVDTIPRRDIAFFELMEASFLILGEIPHTGAFMYVRRTFKAWNLAKRLRADPPVLTTNFGLCPVL